MRPQDSKCWTCTYGVCVQEKMNQALDFEARPITSDEEESENPFDLFEDTGEETDPVYKVSQNMVHTRIKSVCFWRSSGDDTVAIPMEFVEECNRYERDTRRTS